MTAVTTTLRWESDRREDRLLYAGKFHIGVVMDNLMNGNYRAQLFFPSAFDVGVFDDIGEARAALEAAAVKALGGSAI